MIRSRSRSTQKYTRIGWQRPKRLALRLALRDRSRRPAAHVAAAEAAFSGTDHSVAAALQNLTDGVELQDVAVGIEAEKLAHGVELRTIRRAGTPGAWRRPRITLPPLLKDWDAEDWSAAASSDHDAHHDRCLNW